VRGEPLQVEDASVLERRARTRLEIRIDDDGPGPNPTRLYVGGHFRKLCDELGFAALEVPPGVGGRFSVLSPVGAALVGIPVGEPMPFATIEGVPRVVTALSVDPEPKVTSLTQWRRPAPRTAEHDPYDPGPSAA